MDMTIQAPWFIFGVLIGMAISMCIPAVVCLLNRGSRSKNAINRVCRPPVGEREIKMRYCNSRRHAYDGALFDACPFCLQESIDRPYHHSKDATRYRAKAFRTTNGSKT